MDYDESITVGSLITAYHSGFHILTRIEFRDGAEPLFFYQKVADTTGKRSRELKYHCSAWHCKKLTRSDLEKIYTDEVKAAEAKLQNLLLFVD